jgi:hypothetical protein
MLHDFLSAHTEIILLIAGASLVAFVISIILLPIIIIRLPEDFFIREPEQASSLSPFRILLKLIKNLLGIALLLVGFIMLFIPGQGILTILFGICLMDFPGKRKLEARLVSRPRVYRSLDWLRQKAQRPSFVLERE